MSQTTDTIVAIDSITIKQAKDRMSKVEHFSMSRKEIDLMPKFLGLADPLKAIKHLPGFGNGGDGNAGLYFRGLGSGDNGYYFNGIQIQNPTHFLGLFPVFNTETVSEVKVYHTLHPGMYTGKISTYLDVNSDWKTGDTTSYQANISPFHAAAGLRIERPSRLLDIQFRKTFMNQTLWPYVQKLMDDIDKVAYDLYDLNINAQHIFSKQLMRFVFYQGQDLANLGLHNNTVSNRIKWGNRVLGLEHRYHLDNGTEIISRVNRSIYHIDTEMDFSEDAIAFSNKQNNTVFSVMTNSPENKLLKEAGVVMTHYALLPRENRSDAVMTQYSFPRATLWHTKLFASLQKSIWKKLHVTVQASYHHLDQQHYLEYQALVDYPIGASTKVYVSNTMSRQPIHHVPLTNISVPVDFMVASKNNIRPSTMNQNLVGFRYTKNNRLEFSVDAYYRNMQHLYEFNGDIIQLNTGQELTDLMNEGKGIAYGVDIFSKISRPPYFLLFNYSYARSFRKTTGVNHDNWYPFIYDRPHNSSAVFQYTFSKKLEASASFVVNSGNTYTPDIGRYYFNNHIVGEYGTKNSARTKIYHRLDLGVSYKIRSKAGYTQQIGLSIINLYNRKNPLYQYLSYDQDHFDQHGSFWIHQRTVGIIPFMPSITYTIRR